MISCQQILTKSRKNAFIPYGEYLLWCMRMVSTTWNVNLQSDRANLYCGYYFRSAHSQIMGYMCVATNIGNRDLLLTNIGIAENFSVRYGTYPGEKSLPSYASGVHRESKDDWTYDRLKLIKMYIGCSLESEQSQRLADKPAQSAEIIARLT